MKNQTLKFTLLAIISLFLISSVLFPKFTSQISDLKQKVENEFNSEENLQKKLAEEKRIKEEEIERNYLLGKFNPAEKEEFVLVESKYSFIPYNIYLRKETYNAYLQMQKLASVEGVSLKISSATRNFNYQKEIWNKKWAELGTLPGKDKFEKILEYTAAPGTSRHHWGTDIDINGAVPAYFNTKKGKREYEWLQKNASLFGFCQTYELKEIQRETGHKEEKWHWSYLPLAKSFTQRYADLIKEEDIAGFMGDEYVPNFDLINKYALSINPDCL